MNGHQNKTDDTNMMEVILKSSPADKLTKQTKTNGHYGSSNNLAPAGGLPGVRGRTRQPVNGNGMLNFLK